MKRNEAFSIYVDRLEEHPQKIQEVISPEFMHVNEETLKFEHPVTVQGEAYLATGNLILHLSAQTQAAIPCTICNEWVDVPIAFKGLYVTVPLSEIKRGVYDFSEPLREEILIATPPFAECHGGQCPQRSELNKFLKKGRDGSEEEDYHPFADL